MLLVDEWQLRFQFNSFHNVMEGLSCMIVVNNSTTLVVGMWISIDTFVTLSSMLVCLFLNIPRNITRRRYHPYFLQEKVPTMYISSCKHVSCLVDKSIMTVVEFLRWFVSQQVNMSIRKTHNIFPLRILLLTISFLCICLDVCTY